MQQLNNQHIWKPLCVFGCLLTDEGKRIKNEMLSWLRPIYNVFCVDQEPPGVFFEYPAMLYAAKLSIDTRQPVLYIHTKGAANKNHLQAKVRKVWQHEFGTEYRRIYWNTVASDQPIVVAPFVSPEGSTWFNAFIMNTAAANILMDVIDDQTHPISMHLAEQNIRYRYEHIFRDTSCKVIGILKPCPSKLIWGHECWKTV
jgi:hypothetical protein